MSDQDLDKKIEEMFRDKVYSVFKEYHETNSQTLKNIYENQNGYSPIWKFIKGNVGAVISVITVLGIIGSIWIIPVKIDYRIQSIEKEIKTNTENTVEIKEAVKDITAILGEHNGRISKIEGKLETKKTE